MKNPQPNHVIGMDQLRVGLYIHLDLGWMDHPFTFSNFKIRTEQQLAQVKALKLRTLRYDPLRSDCDPLPQEIPPAVPEEPTMPAEETTAASEATPELLAFQIQRLRQLQEAIRECETKFEQAIETTHSIERNLRTNPPRSMQQAQLLVESMVESVLTASDVVLHAMQAETGLHSHPLNVAVIALTMAKALDMEAQEASWLGQGALFHDIGKNEIPDRVARKAEPLTHAELALLEQHCELGARTAAAMGMHERIVTIIRQHHECMDGSGYPAGLKGDQIDWLSRIIVVANIFENLCNPLDMACAMTPYEALAHMFAHLRSKFDASLLTLLIKGLGVYPPGSIVQLSDGRYGLVMSVNPSKPLLPFVMLHAPEVPRETPLLVNLGEQGTLRVTRCLRRNQLPREALEYLNPSLHINYFYDREVPADPGEPS